MSLSWQWKAGAHASRGSREQWHTDGAVRHVGERHPEIPVGSAAKPERLFVAKPKVEIREKGFNNVDLKDTVSRGSVLLACVNRRAFSVREADKT